LKEKGGLSRGKKVQKGEWGSGQADQKKKKKKKGITKPAGERKKKQLLAPGTETTPKKMEILCTVPKKRGKKNYEETRGTKGKKRGGKVFVDPQFLRTMPRGGGI